MNFAQTIPLADGWGMHGGGAGWWIVVPVLMMLFMGGMMWMMMRGMGGGSSKSSPASSESRATTETPVQILERRFAEGTISVEEYQARRERLVHGSSGSNGAHKEEPLTAAPPGGGSQ
jgi:putative membrane protein